MPCGHSFFNDESLLQMVEMAVVPLTRRRIQALLVLTCVGTLAGCTTPAGPVGPAEPSPAPWTEGTSLVFGTPVTAIPACGATGTQACFEPSFAASVSGVLVANSLAAPMGFSTHGSPFLRVDGPNSASLAAGGDAMVQATSGGDVWWIDPKTDHVQLTKSTNGGLTWGTTSNAQTGSLPDRPWLVEAPQRALLTFQGPNGIHAMASSDGGGSWTQPVLLDEAHIHGHGVWCGDRFLVPVLRMGKAFVLSSVEGTTWASHALNLAGQFFPAIACSGKDVWFASLDFDGHILVSRSHDSGTTWGSAFDAGFGAAATGSPWLAARGGALWLAAFTGSDGPAALQVIRIEAGQAHRGTAASNIATTYRKDRPGNSDFAFLDFVGDAASLVYADGDGSIKLVAVSG